MTVILTDFLIPDFIPYRYRYYDMVAATVTVQRFSGFRNLNNKAAEQKTNNKSLKRK
jgi:hypothetical protein